MDASLCFPPRCLLLGSSNRGHMDLGGICLLLVVLLLNLLPFIINDDVKENAQEREKESSHHESVHTLHYCLREIRGEVSNPKE